MAQQTEWQRRLAQRAKRTYLKPQVCELFEAYAKSNEMSESSALNVMVKDFFSRMTPDEKARYSQSGGKNHY